MLADEGVVDTASEDGASGQAERDRAPREGASQLRAYSPAVHRTLERPIRDFLPARLVVIGILLTGGLLFVGALAAGHIFSPRLMDQVGAKDEGLFDLASGGNVSRWFSSTLLTLAAVACLVLFALRRHRVDDYHGRYRMWLLASLACFAMSFAEASNFGHTVRHLSDSAATASNVSSGLAWVMFSGGALLLAGARLLIEVRRCKGAVAMLSLAGVGVLGATAAAHGWIEVLPAEHHWGVARSLWLAAYVFLLGTLLTYARYVILEVEGKVAVKVAAARKTKRKKKTVRKAAEPSESDEEQEAAHEHAHVRSPASTLKLATAAEARHEHRSDTRSSDSDDQRGLSRKERRKLRRAA
jgi:hypothetical protein